MNNEPSRTGSAPTLMFRGNYSGNREQSSEIFTSFPALADAASYLTQTTSYLTRCFAGSADESVLDDGEELVTFSSGEAHISDSVNGFTAAHDSVGSGTTLMTPDERGTASLGGSSQAGTGPLVSTSVFQIGPSIFQGLISRARKTVLGSADDIGWLQRAPGMPPVEDGTKRFIELLENIREIKEYIEEIYWGSKKRILLLGHSKGGVDSAAALSLYWPDLKDKVAGLALAQSPYGGSPIASDILREGQLGDYVQLRKIMQVLICKVLKGDLQALEDLTYEKRREFLRKHPLPRDLPVVSFHTEAGLGPSVLASLSQVAHAELPIIGDGPSTKVPVVMPLSAAMAACAQLLQVRYGEKSDGLVTRRDAEVPGSVVVRPERKLDHAWMVYSTLNDSPGEADASQVCEALLTLLVEVGQKRRHEAYCSYYSVGYLERHEGVCVRVCEAASSNLRSSVDEKSLVRFAE
ncbi:hypothetical protein MA16_Dca022260 [Dendrobium catenatum]|uniref:Uncharacterized protein n=1 Tax=Dendrobium catenatum TaxID=906689 RepID=A0A2I0W2Y3_9ASPA|nr:hypothetical protein MA16_Dca022260 [Dendrobium catenatum]